MTGPLGDGFSYLPGPSGQGWGLDRNQCLQVICVKTLWCLEAMRVSSW